MIQLVHFINKSIFTGRRVYRCYERTI